MTSCPILRSISNDFLHSSTVVRAIFIAISKVYEDYMIGGTTWGVVFGGGGQKIFSAAVGVEMQKKFLDHPQKTILITH